ncbi:MAG: hypothetical protein MUF49_03440 [Oculatellaceae cyanobacterium Prado106]|jgi:hypothetical protein|nr:hypothetical protein [Oculatellaceae cyanobacterium Prado106]
MAYSEFTLAKVQQAFDLTLEEGDWFAAVPETTPSAFLIQTLEENQFLATAIGTEKARSEFLIAPILVEVRRQLHYQAALFSGTEFNVEPSQGLQGFCDFLLSASKEQFFIQAPVVTIVEAKKEDLIGGLGQCVATMVGAQLFNQRSGNPIETIYGAVTSGTNWRFLRLKQQVVQIDSTEYFLVQVPKILGILLEPFHPAPVPPTA